MEENIVLETAFDRSVIFRCYVFKPVTILQLNLPAFSLPAVAQRLILSSTLNANMPSIPRGLSNDSVVQGSMVEIWKRKRGLCKFCHFLSLSLSLSLFFFSRRFFHEIIHEGRWSKPLSLSALFWVPLAYSSPKCAESSEWDHSFSDLRPHRNEI